MLNDVYYPDSVGFYFFSQQAGRYVRTAKLSFFGPKSTTSVVDCWNAGWCCSQGTGWNVMVSADGGQFCWSCRHEWLLSWYRLNAGRANRTMFDATVQCRFCRNYWRYISVTSACGFCGLVFVQAVAYWEDILLNKGDVWCWFIVDVSHFARLSVQNVGVLIGSHVG